MKTQRIRFVILANDTSSFDQEEPVKEYGYSYSKELHNQTDVFDETNYDQEVYYSLTDRGDFD